MVSDVKGTTTDPVYKSMELLPLGPVVIIDTPGFDDEGALGELRVKKTKQVLNKDGCGGSDRGRLHRASALRPGADRAVSEEGDPYLVVYNKADLLTGAGKETAEDADGRCSRRSMSAP